MSCCVTTFVGRYNPGVKDVRTGQYRKIPVTPGDTFRMNFEGRHPPQLLHRFPPKRKVTKLKSNCRRDFHRAFAAGGNTRCEKRY
eukprot:812148-Amorphochlora_amoeboformis.AAC.2